MPFDLFLERFDRVNLLHVRQDTKEKGFEFDLRSARIAAEAVKTTFRQGQVVLFLGGRVAEAFRVHDEYFAPTTINEAACYIVPHPSGVNRWWNDPENRLKAEKFLRTINEGIR